MGRAGRLGAAGFCAIAVSFGPARAGYGLFLPQFRDEFGLSIQLSGLVASGLQAGYLVSLVAVGLLVARVGARAPILLGMLAAALGMGIVAGAPGTAWLAAGVVVAGTSAGWSWAPYNDAVGDEVPRPLQGRVLSVISTGTTFGVLILGVTAFVVGASWRTAWLAFAVTALVAGP
ncbi:MFS transporter [Rubrobacter tropicus]|uniref:MFS transporter n=1 Tax=Rubrobacter tropicus TaxID=2653851 RepID=UPI00140DC992|nr:MFS transporter [Rubrobacter tropicus]